MGSELANIRNAINQMVLNQLRSKNIIIFGEVVSINETDKTIDVLNIKGDGADTITNVRYSYNNAQNELLPVLGSQVVVIRNYDDNSMYLSRVETVDKMLVKVDSLIDIAGRNMNIAADEVNFNTADTKGQIIFNGGENYGMCKISELTAKLNQYENAFNALGVALNSWVPDPNPATALNALKSIFSGWVANYTPMTLSVMTDIENNLVQH